MKKRNGKKWKMVLLLLLIGFIGIQFIRPSIPTSPVSSNSVWPANVDHVLKSACYDCHSNQTSLKWFDQIAPAYWLVASHVKEARKALNFSDWDKLMPADQKARLYLSLNTILEKEMPLSSYTLLHSNARVDSNEIDILKNYLISISPQKVSDSGVVSAAKTQYDTWIAAEGKLAANVKPAPNNIEYIPGYRNWTAISTTDRFDNGTFRVIFGNDIAVKAIKENHINPWPDGATFAKVAWTKLIDSTGNASSGEFKQVEFMIKDSKKYSSTNGWGWARWKGTNLTPYGKDAGFTNECTSCHEPMKDNDFVFTIPINLNATLEQKVITSGMKEKTHTMYTLYANDIGAQHATTANGQYPAGTILSLVTWTQRPDAHWFGGNIPKSVESVEVVQFDSSNKPVYTCYSGTPLSVNKSVQNTNERVAFIVNKKAAVTP